MSRLLLTACLAALALSAPAYGALIEGTGGDDILYGTRHADTIKGRGGNDFIAGHRGANTLNGGPGIDDLRGNRGPDWLWAQDGELDVVNCGPGDDFAVIDSGLDVVAANCEGVGGIGPP